MFSKQVSFIVDHKGNRKAAVVPIEIFDELMAMQKALASRQPGEREPVIALREELLQKGVLVAEADGYRFVQDQLFNSPSLAASLIAGNNRSGLDAWSNPEGFTRKQSGYGKRE